MKLFTALGHYFHTLKERERYMLIIGSITVLLYFLYIGVYQPITSAIRYSEQQLMQQQITLAMLQNAKKNIPQIPTETQNTNQLLVKISRSLSIPSLKAYPHVLQQQENDEITLHFNTIPYLQFNKWLWQLQQENPMLYIKKIHMEKTQTKGHVKIHIIFKTNI